MKSFAGPVIRLRGVRHNNLKNFDLDLPLNQLIVITGLSGSGKSSLAFDTLFAEGQRRYIETFSPYARQFLDRMDKPQVDSIEGIPPAIAIEQRNAVKTTRSTVGTMTEICDYMKMLWPHISQLHCRQCGKPVRKDSPQAIWEKCQSRDGGNDLLITFEVPMSEKLSLEESLALISKQGYQRLLLKGQVARLDEAASLLGRKTASSRVAALTVIQDRLKPILDNRARFIEACEQAYHFGKGKLALHEIRIGETPSPAPAKTSEPFSNQLHCAKCDIEYREPSPALFSFNHPVGACPKCRGFGRIISIDYNLALPDRSRTLAQGVVKPWLTGQGLECQTDLLRMCRQLGIPTDVPFEKLSDKWQKLVVDGEPDYGKDEEHEWPRAWYGVKGYFRWLESKAYKMHVRVLLSRYRSYTTCPDCGGKRFQPDALLYMVRTSSLSIASDESERNPAPGARRPHPGPDPLPALLTLADFYELPIRDALGFIDALGKRAGFAHHEPLGLVLNEVRSRLGYLNEVGLGYLTLDRPTRSLSGGETERVNLTTCLGTCLVNTLFVLDEPSVGLHPRDTERLVRILERLRDAGNTVVVVEHEASVMRAANQLVDLGPGQGAAGGRVIFQGSYGDILKSAESLTGAYLSGNRQLELPERRPVSLSHISPRTAYSAPGADHHQMALNDSPATSLKETPYLQIRNATRHNLKSLAVQIPLGRFVCITGVSGSGKTTLVREILVPALTEKFRSDPGGLKASERLSPDSNGDQEDDSPAPHLSQETSVMGWEHLERVALVDQSILGKTPRSNPAVYIGAFDHIRELFAGSEPARQRGLNASAFSFNSAQGQCERCRGAGFEKIEMQFLSDVFIRCPDCNGRRYRSHILEVKIQAPSEFHPRNGERDRTQARPAAQKTRRAGLSIADLLDSTIDEAIEFLAKFEQSPPARRAIADLGLLQEVGLGYLKLGQPINTLSGGESQRLKLVRHLAEATSGQAPSVPAVRITRPRYPARRAAIPLEPPTRTTGATRTLFLFDEPTTGLHFDDVRILLKVFQRLVDAGHSVLVIEHNLDVIKSADWLIDLGPDAGDQGGQVVAEGTPEQVAACPRSHTGQALRAHLATSHPQERARCE
jgi:excinuclease ABC subunit A